MSRYKVSPDGSNGYMQWFVVRDDGGGRWTRVGPSFDDPSDGYDERSAEERAEGPCEGRRVMATTEEQEWAGRLEEAFEVGFDVGSGLRGGYLAEARLVLADRAALVERAERAEEAHGAAVEDHRALAAVIAEESRRLGLVLRLPDAVREMARLAADRDAQGQRAEQAERERESVRADLKSAHIRLADHRRGATDSVSLEAKRCAEIVGMLAMPKRAKPYTWSEALAGVWSYVNATRNMRQHVAGLQRGSVREAIGVLSAGETTLDAAKRLRADRDRIAAELEAVRGSGGVLTREECAAALEEHTGCAFTADVEGCAVGHSEIGARAQRARDVAVVRAEVERLKREASEDPQPGRDSRTAGALACLAALTSDAAPAPASDGIPASAVAREVGRLAGERDEQERRAKAAEAERDAARSEVERMKAEAHFWREKCQMQIEQAVPTPPADLDGWLGIYDRAANAENDAREKAGLECHREEDEMAGVAAVLAARDAWWEERLVSDAAVEAASTGLGYMRVGAGISLTDAVTDVRSALRAAIAAVRASAAPARLPDERSDGAVLAVEDLSGGTVRTCATHGPQQHRRVDSPEAGPELRCSVCGEPSAAPAPAQPAKMPPAEDRFIRAYVDGDPGLRLGQGVRDGIARVVAAVRADLAGVRCDLSAALPPLPAVPACPVSEDDLARWRECGPYSKSRDDAVAIALHDRLDALGAPHAGCAFERIDMLASTSTRAAFLEMAEECERRALEHEAELAGCGKRGRRCGECAIRDARAIDARSLAAWARGRAGE